MRRLGLCIGIVVCLMASNTQANGLERYIITIQGPAEQAVERAGGVVDHAFSIIPAIAVRIPAAAIPGILKNPNVISIEPDIMLHATGKPPWAGGGGGDTEQPAQVIEWGVDRIDAELTWHTAAGYGVSVAIIDTGIDKDHPDLIDNLMGGVNFVPKRGRIDPNTWDDDNGHGTHVAGIVGAVDNDGGVVGVAPEVSLYGVKALNRRGSGYLSDIIAGIEWAVNNDIQVINMSLGTDTYTSTLKAACDAAYALGVTLVAAAGNDGDIYSDSDVDYPAAYASVIAVAAINIADERASWSSDGPEVELAAPGVNIRSTWKKGEYNTISGTSMASPHVAGVAALALSNEALTPGELRYRLQNTADDLGDSDFDPLYGHGLVDAEEAAVGIQTNP